MVNELDDQRLINVLAGNIANFSNFFLFINLYFIYLNKKQNMPIEDSSVDVGLIVAGWQYLQYPEKVSLELSRVIKSDSLLIISFTNRAFWTKAPNIWTYSSEEKRIAYVTSVLTSNGWRIEKILNEVKGYESNAYNIESLDNKLEKEISNTSKLL